jgi:HEPN domain-containing protein
MEVKMDQTEIFETWKNEAQKDLTRADFNTTSEDWDEVVYHCQQALEKLAKAIYSIFLKKKIPFVHDIESIVNKFEDKLSEPVSKERLALFAKLSGFYIDDRYPAAAGEKNEYDKATALQLLSQTKEAFEWLLNSTSIPNSTESEQSTPSSEQ